MRWLDRTIFNPEWPEPFGFADWTITVATGLFFVALFGLVIFLLITGFSGSFADYLVIGVVVMAASLAIWDRIRTSRTSPSASR